MQLTKNVSFSVSSAAKAAIWPLLICFFVAGVCFPHIIGKLLLIGNSDRLTSFINIRMFEIQALQELGRIPLWNDRMFGGFNMTSLHYMIPVLHPISRVLALAPSHFMYLIGLWAIFSYLCVGLSAYFLFKDLTRDRFLAAVGAIIYLMGYQVYFRAFQVDDAVINYAMLPFGILMIRRLGIEFKAVYFLGLFACVVFIMLSFLQESSYVLIMIGIYALVAAWRHRSWELILIVAAAIASALLLTAPRIVGIYFDMKDYSRSSSLGLNSEWEFFRLIYDGLFGRNFEEAAQYTKVHVHEGYATYTSIFAPLVLMTIGFFSSSRLERLPLLGVLIFFDTVLISLFAVPLWVHFAIVLGGLTILLDKPTPAIGRSGVAFDDDQSFYVWSFLIFTACILNPTLRTGVYYLFLKMDFSHSRLSILVIFSLAAAVSIILARFVRRYHFGTSLETSALENLVLKAPHWTLVCLTAGFICDFVAQRISWKVFGPVPIPLHLGGMTFILQAAVYSTEMIAIFVAVTVAFILMRTRMASAVPVYVLSICGLLVGSGANYTYFELFGTPNRSFPIAFRNHNMFAAPADVFRMPQGEGLRGVQTALEAGKYRSAFLFNPNLYNLDSYYQSYLAQFWQLRVVDGYVPAVPTRLAEFPWPPGVVGLRTIHFSTVEDLSWPILAFLNVKYAIDVDNDFFFNIHSEADHSPFTASQLRIISNPLHVTPRYFFANNVVPLAASNNGQKLLSKCPDDAAPGTIAEDGKPFPSSALVSTKGIPLPLDPRKCSIVNGLGESRQFSIEGQLSVEFQQDRVIARMSPSSQERFLVLNERDNSAWQAHAGGNQLRVWETNLAMRGVVVPKNTTEVVFSFRPFPTTRSAMALIIAGILAIIGTTILFSSLYGRKKNTVP